MRMTFCNVICVIYFKSFPSHNSAGNEGVGAVWESMKLAELQHQWRHSDDK